MRRSPFIRPIRFQGGTMYSFQSASNDWSFTRNNDERRVRFSKFALLKIPEFANNDVGLNTLQLNAIPGGFETYDSANLNDSLAESFQNYLLNYENLILQSNYDAQQETTVSERLFFKWLKDTGAIRFRQANNREVTSPAVGARYVEEDESDTYNRVVQYLGSIDIANNVKRGESSYQEAYIHVPTNHGDTPNILFQVFEDQNYKSNQIRSYNPVEFDKQGNIVERSSSESHPVNLSFIAHYDSQLGVFDTPNYLLEQENTSGFTEGWWYSFPRDNSYITPSNFGDQQNQKLRITGKNEFAGTNVNILRNRLDGIKIDFDVKSYYDVQFNPNIQNMDDYNASPLSRSFEFNAMLIYYDLYDPTDESVSTTNLFGVMFLDQIKQTSPTQGTIQSFEKYRPDLILGSNGNSYGYKLNLRQDIDTDDVINDKTINSYSTFSLHVYTDALNEMKKSVAGTQSNLLQIQDLQKRLENLESFYINSTQLQELENRVNDLETQFFASTQVFENSDEILELINRNYQEIQNIINNQTSIEMSYNLDVIRGGKGISIDRTVPNIVSVINDKQQFNFGPQSIVSLDDDFNLLVDKYRLNYNLRPFANYFKIDNRGNFEPDRDIYVFINDTGIRWTTSQHFRITMEFPITMRNASGQHNLHIVTDAADLNNVGQAYTNEIRVVTFDEFESLKNKPIIDIYCIDGNALRFTVDVH